MQFILLLFFSIINARDINLTPNSILLENGKSFCLLSVLMLTWNYYEINSLFTQNIWANWTFLKEIYFPTNIENVDHLRTYPRKYFWNATSFLFLTNFSFKRCIILYITHPFKRPVRPSLLLVRSQKFRFCRVGPQNLCLASLQNASSKS